MYSQNVFPIEDLKRIAKKFYKKCGISVPKSRLNSAVASLTMPDYQIQFKLKYEGNDCGVNSFFKPYGAHDIQLYLSRYLFAYTHSFKRVEEMSEKLGTDDALSTIFKEADIPVFATSLDMLNKKAPYDLFCGIIGFISFFYPGKEDKLLSHFLPKRLLFKTYKVQEKDSKKKKFHLFKY